jgi:hypothetical protein
LSFPIFIGLSRPEISRQEKDLFMRETIKKEKKRTQRDYSLGFVHEKACESKLTGSD